MRTITMKMAKASEADQDASMIILGILEDVAQGHFPRGIDGEFNESDPEFFDADDEKHLRVFHDRVTTLMNQAPGGLSRVVFGFCGVLASDVNEIIDPDSDVLSWHPKLIAAKAALESPNYARLEAPLVDGTYWVRLAGTDAWFTGRVIGAQTPTPVLVGGLSGSAIALSSLKNAEFAGPIPTPADIAPIPQSSAADHVAEDILSEIEAHDREFRDQENQ